MGKSIYVPEPLSREEAAVLLSQIRKLVGKVDDDVARSVLGRALEDLNNEIHNIENGHRGPQ